MIELNEIEIDEVSGAVLNFFNFVTAHGPFELTAFVLAAGAGLRLGLSWMMPKGLTRGSALRKAGREVMPVVGASMVMFFMAAMIEGFLSPSSAPYSVKAGVAIISSSLLAFYFVVLGFPRGLTTPSVSAGHEKTERQRDREKERSM